tara:strand:+ start:979 stop:1182 length:204 start_codon:yes stop_codon:yes gene_type:complete
MLIIEALMSRSQVSTIIGGTLGALCQIADTKLVRAAARAFVEEDEFWEEIDGHIETMAAYLEAGDEQ